MRATGGGLHADRAPESPPYLPLLLPYRSQCLTVLTKTTGKVDKRQVDNTYINSISLPLFLSLFLYYLSAQIICRFFLFLKKLSVILRKHWNLIVFQDGHSMSPRKYDMIRNCSPLSLLVHVLASPSSAILIDWLSMATNEKDTFLLSESSSSSS